MKKTNGQSGVVLLSGEGNLTWSIAACLLKGGHAVDLWTNPADEAMRSIQALSVVKGRRDPAGMSETDRLRVTTIPKEAGNHQMAVVITSEELPVKQERISQLEKHLSPEAIIGINTESIDLGQLQRYARRPERIIGLNWVEPAHTTRFLEIIGNASVGAGITEQIYNLAKLSWKKDPYVVQDFGIRSKLICAMVREAFYLVANGYASVEDIDRACRNDAGYYLPFAGNCRYMDLMGTYAYGMVMKDLNPDLSKDDQAPAFFTDMLKCGGEGMQNGKGLYNYTEAEIGQWRSTMNTFSHQIEEIISKYPFNRHGDGL